MAGAAQGDFRVRGIHHLALVCKNMERTVHFYRDILGFRLVKAIEFPMPDGSGIGQHFFFDIGNNSTIAFFWYPSAPEAIPGVIVPPISGGVTAQASMNHVAFDVAPEDLEVFRQKLLEKGVQVTLVINHDDSEASVSPEVNETTYVRSIYFKDPDGIRLEMAAWVRDLRPDESELPPSTQDSRPLALALA